MLNQHRYAPMLSTALVGLLMTACGGSDNNAGEPAAIVECPASYAVTLLPVPPLGIFQCRGPQQSGAGRRGDRG